MSTKEVNGKWPDWFELTKATVTQITTLYNCGEQKSLRMHNTLNLEVDGLQQQKTMLGSTSVSKEQKAEAAVGTGSSKWDS